MAEPAKAPKRIAIFLPSMAGGGAERVVLASARDLVSRGHQVDLVLISASGELLPLVPPEVRIIDLKQDRFRSALRRLARYLRQARPDALHAVMWPSTVIAILAHRLARSKARLMVSDQVALSGQVRAPLQRAILKATTRLFYPLADVRVLCSAAAADDLARLSGIARDRFEVITNPTEPPATIATNPRVEALWGEGRPRIITVGSLKDQKNHALLLRAFARLEDYPEARLMIVGEGLLRGVLEAQAGELGVAGRVIMPGFDVDPWPYLASADLFVLSSDYEGFPLVLAEAMHAGLRIVSTDCLSGPAELTDHGRFGRLVPCGDAAALSDAMAAALGKPADPARQRARAAAMAGPGQIARYSELLVG